MQCSYSIFSSVVCPTLQNVATLFHKQLHFRKKVIEHEICFDFLYNFVWKMSYSKKNWVRYDQKCQVLFTYHTRYSSPILIKLEFSGLFFFNNAQLSSLKKIRPMFHAGRRTDRHDEANSHTFLLSTPNKLQRYTIFLIIINALHVSGGFSAHHQELKNYTHSIGYIKLACCYL